MAAGKRLHKIRKNPTDRLLGDVDVAAVRTIDKGICGVNMQSCFRMHIDRQIIRQLKTPLANQNPLHGTFIDLFVQIAEHLPDILGFLRRHIL